MRSSPEAEKARKELKELLKKGCKPGISTPFVRRLGQEPKAQFYAGFWRDLFGRNPTRAFLGSFSGEATVTKCWGCCAVVKFTLRNTVGWKSGTRLPPPYGYDTNRPAFFEKPWTPIIIGGKWVGDVIVWEFDPDHMPSSILPDNAFGKYGQNINVTISWEELICPDNCPFKK
jgi:hypothetical protein